MYKYIVALLLIATPAFAKDIIVTFSDEESKALGAIMDTALKSPNGGGLALSEAVAHFMVKFRGAQQAAEKEAADAVAKPK